MPSSRPCGRHLRHNLRARRDTGKLLWTGHAPTATADLSSAAGVLYVLTVGGQLLAYQESGCGAPTCKPIVIVNDPKNASTITTLPPVVANGYILYANYNGLRALTVP